MATIAQEMKIIASEIKSQIELELEDKKNCEIKRKSIKAEKLLIKRTTLIAIKIASLEGKHYISASCYEQGRCGDDLDPYNHTFKSGLLETHIEMLKSEGFKVVFEGQDRGNPWLHVKWE